MGYGLNRISQITFEGDAFQTPNNRTQGRAPTPTPRKKRDEPQGGLVNKTFPVNQAPRWEKQPRSESYDAEMSIRDAGTIQLLGRYVPPCQMNTDNFASGSSDNLQNLNQTMVFNGKSTGTNQPRNTSMQTSPGKPALIGITGAMQTSPRKV